MATPSITPYELLKSYRDAVWSYLLEHCDLTKHGALFVKFHTSNRATFEKHIRARLKYGYHRGDPAAKNRTHVERRFDLEREKWNARERYLLNRIRGLRMLKRKGKGAAKKSWAKPEQGSDQRQAAPLWPHVSTAGSLCSARAETPDEP
jgi:hypothetical protein